jgi:hypothetical protein
MGFADFPSWRSVYAAAAPKARAISTGGVERHAHLDLGLTQV